MAVDPEHARRVLRCRGVQAPHPPPRNRAQYQRGVRQVLQGVLGGVRRSPGHLEATVDARQAGANPRLRAVAAEASASGLDAHAMSPTVSRARITVCSTSGSLNALSRSGWSPSVAAAPARPMVAASND